MIRYRSPLWYMSLVDGCPADVKLPASFELAPAAKVKSAAAALRAGRPVYALYPYADDGRAMTEAVLNLVLAERGVLYKVVPRDEGRGAEASVSEGCSVPAVPRPKAYRAR